MAKDQRAQALEALTKVALQLQDGNAQDAFSLLHEAAWAAEEQGRRGKRKGPRGQRHAPVLAEVLPPPPAVDGAVQEGAAEDATSTTSSFTRVSEGGEREGREANQAPYAATLSETAQVEGALPFPTYLAGTAVLAGVEGGDGHSAAEAAREDSQEEEEEALALAEDDVASQADQPPVQGPPASPPGLRRPREEEEDSVPSQDGFSEPIFADEDWIQVQGRRSGRAGEKGAHGQAGQTASPVRGASARCGGRADLGSTGARPKKPAPGRDGVSFLHLPEGADNSGVPPLQSGRKGEGLLASGQQGSARVLGSRTDDPAYTLGYAARPGVWEYKEGEGRPRLTALTRVYIPDTTRAWQSVADAARDGHHEDVSKFRGCNYVRAEWDPAENDLFHVLSKENEAIVSLPQFRDFEIPSDYEDSVKCPAIVIGGDSYYAFRNAEARQEAWIEGKRLPQSQEVEEYTHTPSCILPSADFEGTTSLLTENPEIPLQFVEIRGLRSIGTEDGRRVYGAYEGRRAFLFRTPEFDRRSLRAGAFIRLFIHHAQWGMCTRWLEHGGQGDFLCISADLFTASGDGSGSEERFPSHHKFDVRKGLEGRGIRTYGHSFDWGQVGYPRGEESYFPLVVAAGTNISPEPTKHNFLLKGLQQRLLDPFSGKTRCRAPRIRHLATGAGGLQAQVGQDGGITFCPPSRGGRARGSRGKGGARGGDNIQPRGGERSTEGRRVKDGNSYQLDDYGKPARRLNFAQAARKGSASSSSASKSPQRTDTKKKIYTPIVPAGTRKKTRAPAPAGRPGLRRAK